MFETIFANGSVTAAGIFAALGAALAAGIVFAFLSCYGSNSSKSFVIATALLPMTVAMVIALVNGNIGAGVAIAGAFALVRFRSAPGSAKEISVIFISMAAGLAFGMGYLAYGCIFIVFSGMIVFAAERIGFPVKKSKLPERTLKVTIPEDLNYTEVFDGVFEEYTVSHELDQVKTADMGSIFKLTYRVTLKDASREKAMIDALRERNGNLEILSEAVCLKENAL